MKIDITFVPRPDLVPPNRYEFFVQVNYTMFPEMEEEFKVEDYPTSEMYNMEVDIAEEGIAEYFLEIERPYGSYTTALYYREIDGPPDQELKPVEPQLVADYYDDKKCVPEPVSRDKQRERDDEEEKENKEKEREARQAQKELEQRKAKQKAEAQQQLLKQEQNSAKLKVYFSAMDLYFHKVSSHRDSDCHNRFANLLIIAIARRGLQCIHVAPLDLPLGAA